MELRYRGSPFLDSWLSELNSPPAGRFRGVGSLLTALRRSEPLKSLKADYRLPGCTLVSLLKARAAGCSAPDIRAIERVM